MTTTPEIHREVIDTVTVRWIAAPPPLVGTLMFRVGPIDERLKTAGITHLAEHLALDPLRDRDHPFNGAVHVDHTAFWAAGEPDEVVKFLQELCHTLTDIPTDRLAAEARVLSAESQALTGAHYTDLIRAWYGPNGPGLLGTPEYGLEWIGPAHVGAWADAHFTASNAMLTLTGPPPPNLRLNLPPGRYVPVELPTAEYGFRPQRQVKLRSQPAGICLGAVADRSVPLVMAMDIIGRRLREKLRHDLGLVYSVRASYEPLSADDVYIYLGTDCDSEHNVRVSAEFMTEVRAFAQEGPTPVELARTAAETKPGGLDEVAHIRSELNRLAHDELLRHPVVSLAEASAMRTATTAAQVREAFAAVIARCLVIPAPEYDEGLTPRPRRDQPVFPGTQYRARHSAKATITRLVVSAEGVSALAGGRWVSIPYSDLALVTRPSASVRNLYSRTGAWMELDAAAWWRGTRVIRELDARVPPDVLVPVLHHAG